MFKLFNKEQEIKKGNSAEDIEKKEKSIDSEISKNVNIYPMPRRFRAAQKAKNRAKTVGIFIMAGGAIFLIAVSAVAYYYFFREKPVDNTPAAVVAEEAPAPKKDAPPEIIPEPAAPEAEQKDPKESYLEIKAEFDNISDFSGLEAVVLKYGSKNKVSELEQEKSKYENMPDSFEDSAVLSLVKNMPKLNAIGEISASVKGGVATLSMLTADSGQEGTAVLISEDNEWKLESEVWAEIKSGNEEEEIIFQNGVDSDSDGLTDKEEAILGSDANNLDSDGDSYGDFSEIQNLYNPAGTGKLADSAKIKNYINNDYGYEALYPAVFSAAEIGGKDSVIFRSEDNHFIQIIAQANQNRSGISDWYNEQFGGEGAGNLNIISGSGWQGIRSEDGLIVYLADNNLKFIFVISYNQGEQKILEYKNIFEIILKGLVIK